MVGHGKVTVKGEADEEEQREKNERAVAGDEKEGGNLRAGNSASYNK